MTTERVLCMCFGYVPIFIGGGEGLRVEQQGLVRGEKKHSVSVFLRSQKKWKIALSQVREATEFRLLCTCNTGSGCPSKQGGENK